MLKIESPRTFQLSQNYPNPFNPETTIRFDLPIPSKVTLRIYNILGQEVVTLLNGENRPAGFYTARWNGRNGSGNQVASGVYFYRLEAGPFVMVKKMMLLR
jgi:flagellar hook assembly protein FlgD